MFLHNPPQAGPIAFHGLRPDFVARFGSALAFCEHLAQSAGVLLLPGNVYDMDAPYVRMATAAPTLPRTWPCWTAGCSKTVKLRRGVPGGKSLSPTVRGSLPHRALWKKGRHGGVLFLRGLQGRKRSGWGPRQAGMSLTTRQRRGPVPVPESFWGEGPGGESFCSAKSLSPECLSFL